jgi:DNA polymerase-3 subunit delta
VERALALVRARLASVRPAVTWTTLWADDDASRLAEALAGLGAPLLFGGATGLVLRRAEALSAATEERVLAALPTLEQGGRLVLVGRGVDQRRKLVATLAKQGATRAFPRLADEAAARRWAVRLARERGAEIAPAAVDLLAARCGADLAVLAAELEKAALWAGEGCRIGADAVDATLAGTRAAAVEELTDRLARGDVGGASHTLRALLAAGEPPVKVAAFLSANLRRALHVAELAESGLGPDDVAQRLGMPVWLVRKQLGRGRARDLEAALVALRDLDAGLKSSRPAAALFESTLLQIARATTTRRRAAR